MIDLKQLKIRTISPVHIQAGSVENKHGYGLLKDKARYVYAVHPGKLRRYVVQKYGAEKAQQLASAMTQELLAERGEGLESTLNKLGIKPPNDISEITTARVGRKMSRDENQFIRTGRGEPFLPGSSFKGMVRTAVVDHYFRNLPESRQEGIINQALHRLKDRSYDERFAAEKLFEQKLISSINWKSDQSDRVTADPGPHRDLLKAVKVKDSAPLPLTEAAEQEAEKQDQGGAQFEYGQYYSGTVKTVGRGFGFISVPGMEDVHFNFDNYEDNVRDIEEGLWVEFRVTQGRKGPTAINVMESFDAPEPIGGSGTATTDTLDNGVQPMTLDRFSISGDQLKPKHYNTNVEGFYGETVLTITVDQHQLSLMQEPPPFETVDDLLGLVDAFYRRVWTAEQEFAAKYIRGTRIEQFYSGGKTSLGRLGFGMGILSDTVLLHATKEQRVKLRSLTTPHDRKEDLPKSKTFMVSGGGDPLYPMGWITWEDA